MPCCFESETYVTSSDDNSLPCEVCGGVWQSRPLRLEKSREEVLGTLQTLANDLVLNIAGLI